MPLDKNTRNTIANRLASYNRKVKAIQNNPDLSTEGKRKALARLYATEQAAVTGMRQTAAGNVAKRRADLEKQLFAVAKGDYQAQAAYQAAQDRVAAIKTGAQAQQEMRNAIRSGNEMTALALFDRASTLAGDRLMGSGWGEVATAYIAEFRPELQPAMEELATLQNADTRVARFEEQIGTSVNRPPELRGMSDYDMRGLVEQDATAGDAA